jgi:hypothetical protein
MLWMASLLGILVAQDLLSDPRFVSEHVRLSIMPEQLRVHGTYHFLRGGKSGPFAILYPFIQDASMGPPEGIRVTIDGLSSPYGVEDGTSIRVSLPFARGDAPACTLEVDYVQRLTARRASYLVTSTSLWECPLEWATFDVDLADSLGYPRSEFSFERAGPGRYTFTETDFLPKRDLVIAW